MRRRRGSSLAVFLISLALGLSGLDGIVARRTDRRILASTGCEACSDEQGAAQACNALSSDALASARTFLLSSCTSAALLASSDACCSSPQFANAMACLWWVPVSGGAPVEVVVSEKGKLGVMLGDVLQWIDAMALLSRGVLACSMPSSQSRESP